MSKNIIFAQKMTKLWAYQISQNKKNTLYIGNGLKGNNIISTTKFKKFTLSWFELKELLYLSTFLN